MKFSIIIPVYNTRNYLNKCLNSVKNQTYKNFEVIIVNDGSTDNSQNIIDKFVADDVRFNSYIKKNGGLSDARNYGLDYVTGDYICFLDSDDYLDEQLLEQLNNIEYDYDIIKFKIKVFDENNNLIKKEKSLCSSGAVSIEQLSGIEFLEPAWTYVYKTSYFKSNNFKYEVGRIHEDYGLTPLCLIKANKIYYLDYFGYYYIKRKGSITNSFNSNKRIDDMLFHYDNLINIIDKETNISLKDVCIFKNMLSVRLIYSLKYLSKNDINEYISEIKKRNVSKNIIVDSITKYLKKNLFQYFPNLYLILLKLFSKG